MKGSEMTARTLAEDFHWLTDGCGRVWIVHDDNVAPCCAWPEDDAPYYCFEPEPERVANLHPEPAPEPEAKYQVWQWLRLGAIVGRVRYRWWHKCKDGTACWRYGCGDFEGNEDCLEPCAPVLTDDQRTIQPGDTVRVVDVPVDGGGKPYSTDHPIPPGREFVVNKMVREQYRGMPIGECWAEFDKDGGADLHNLELVEKGGQP